MSVLDWSGWSHTHERRPKHRTRAVVFFYRGMLAGAVLGACTTGGAIVLLLRAAAGLP